MVTVTSGMFFIILAICSVQLEGHHGNYNYGGNYGGGGGHYAIGFSDEDLSQLCGTNNECIDCFKNSQDIGNETRTLRVGQTIDCATRFLLPSGWFSTCNDYANSLMKSGNDTLQNGMAMLSFCYRTAAEFVKALECPLPGEWRPFYNCFSASGGKKGSGETGGVGRRRRSIEEGGCGGGGHCGGHCGGGHCGGHEQILVPNE